MAPEAASHLCVTDKTKAVSQLVLFSSPSPLHLTMEVPLACLEGEGSSAAVWESHTNRIRVKVAMWIMVAVSLVYPLGASPDRCSLTCAH